MDTATAVELDLPAPRAAVFPIASDPAVIAACFVGFGPIAPIREIRALDEDGPGAGHRRAVHNGDGSVITEEVTAFEPGRRHAYRLVAGFTPPFSWLVTGADAEWTFADSPTGTRIRWSYTFHLTSPLAWPIAAPIVAIAFRGAMRRCLQGLAARVTGS